MMPSRRPISVLKFIMLISTCIQYSFIWFHMEGVDQEQRRAPAWPQTRRARRRTEVHRMLTTLTSRLIAQSWRDAIHDSRPCSGYLSSLPRLIVGGP